MAAGQTGQAARVRGTQSLVHTLGRCWRRPSLTGLEVLWRWAFGVPVLWAVYGQVRQILLLHAAGADGSVDFRRLGLNAKLLGDPVGSAAADPIGVSEKLRNAVSIVWPDVVHVATWLVPVLLVVWVVMSAIGRTLVLRRMDKTLHTRVGTLMGLQSVKMAALMGSFAIWFGCLHWASNVAVTRPLVAGNEPNLVLYFAIVIVSTLGLFSAWAAVSWVLSVAPLVAMLRNSGVAASLRAGLRLGPMRGKLVEVNLVLGIVKIGLIVLAMVFSSTPLPFESVTTPEFLREWWVGVAIFYFVASDFFHVARLMAYLELWRVYEG
jgi:hypothetical protein